MDSVTVRAYVSASREDLFDFVSDISARVSFTDHYMRDYRLANPAARGVGASARYYLRAPLNHHYVETQIVEAERPRRILESTHGGRGGRSRGEIAWEFVRAGKAVTEVELTILWEAGTPRERLMEKLGTRRWLRRKSKKSLERLRVLFEEPRRGPLPHTSIAAFEPSKSARFGISLPEGRR